MEGGEADEGGGKEIREINMGRSGFHSVRGGKGETAGGKIYRLEGL